jgi:hypothetical protein
MKIKLFAFVLAFCMIIYNSDAMECGYSIPSSLVSCNSSISKVFANVGSVQLLLDVCKGTRGLFRRCFGWCLLSDTQKAADKEKLRADLIKKQSKILDQLRSLEE